MTNDWYYVDADGQQAGPVDDAGLDGLIANATIRAETLVWKEGMANWEALSQAKPGVAAAPAGTAVATGIEEAICAECGNIFPIDDTIRLGNARVCAKCKPIYVQKMREGLVRGSSDNPDELRFAGFWIRLAAKLLDNIFVLIVMFFVVMLPFALIMGAVVGASRGRPNIAAILGVEMCLFGVAIILPVIYSGFFIGKYGATPGKMICRLRVVKADGTAASYGRGFGRGAAEILSSMIFSIGYIIAAFDSQKRALHDHICGTRVIHK
jgi:uncharacterized RDD family membrane protein YckC